MSLVEPLVSVVTLTFNNFDLIDKTIKSVYSQKYSNFEYIICDDGSTDFPEDYIQSLIPNNKIDTFRIIRHLNVGTVKNINIAFHLCHGEYLIPLAGDDTFASDDVISCIVKAFHDTNADIISAKRACKDEENRVIQVVPMQSRVDLINNGSNKEILEELYISFFLSGSSLYYSKKVFNKYGGFDERYRLIEDFPFCIRLLQDGGKIAFLDKVTINYGMYGITYQKRGRIRSQIKKDRIRYYNEFIFPNISGMNHLNRQRLRFKYYEMCGSDNNILYFFQLLSCFDFILIKLFKKIIWNISGENK